MKKLVSFLIIFVLAFTSVFAAESPFSDIENHWGKEEIIKAAQTGVVNGYEDGSFRPDGTVTRAEFLKMVSVTIIGDPDAVFPELEGSTHWADKYYAFATNYFLVPATGVSYDGVEPGNMTAENYDLPISRWEMAYIIDCALSNVFTLKTFSYLFTNDFVPADIDSIFETYHPNIAYAISNMVYCGISNGDENGNFNAGSTGTRAEAAAIVNRFASVAKTINDEYIRLIEERFKKYTENKITYTEDQIPEEGTVVLFTMEDGTEFEITLDPKNAPQTCANFVSLVNQGFYNGLTFHRIVKGFVMQGGDPEGNGKGGAKNNITGEFAANGIENPISHTKGVVSMARSMDHNDSATSQFFICFEDVSSYLDSQYAAFGKVTKGMELIEKYQDVEVTESNGEKSRPVTPIVIKSAVVKK